jgi:hypothetical protein
VVQAPVGGLAAGADGGRECGTSRGDNLARRPQRLLVVPGRLDQQPPGMGVAGLGDRALAAAGAVGPAS